MVDRLPTHGHPDDLLPPEIKATPNTKGQAPAMITDPGSPDDSVGSTTQRTAFVHDVINSSAQ